MNGHFVPYPEFGSRVYRFVHDIRPLYPDTLHPHLTSDTIRPFRYGEGRSSGLRFLMIPPRYNEPEYQKVLFSLYPKNTLLKLKPFF